MNKIKAIIVDDEEGARNVLENLLKRNDETIEIMAKCCDVLTAVSKIKELKPNVVFLDVQMPNYAGYEITNFIDKIDFEIVFVTAYDQYAIKAFQLNAIDYLVKPIDRNELTKTIHKLQKKLKQQKNINDYQNLLKSIKKREFNKIVIPELGNRRIVNLDDVIAIEADGAYSKLHLINNKQITSSKNLKYFENTLPKELFFFRSHRAWIINLSYIEFLNKTEQTITLGKGKDVLIAKITRGKFNDFEKNIQ